MKAFLDWIKRWLATAYEASTRVEFYRRVGERKTGEAFGHLAMLAIVWTLPITIMFFIGLRQATRLLAEGLREDIPPGTVFEMKNGVLTNNLQAPLVFRESDAVVIINTATTTLALEEGEDGVVIDSGTIVQQDGAKREVTDYRGAPDFKFGREELMENVRRWAPLALFVVSLLVLVFMFLAFWAGMILNALLHGFALWLLLKVIKRQRPWRWSFIAAAYAATASAILRLAVQGFERMSVLPDILYWGFIGWIAYDAYKGGSHERKEAAPDRPHAEGESKPV